MRRMRNSAVSAAPTASAGVRVRARTLGPGQNGTEQIVKINPGIQARPADPGARQELLNSAQHLTRKQRDLLEAFEAEARHDKHQPESEGFFARVKEFFDGGRG